MSLPFYASPWAENILLCSHDPRLSAKVHVTTALPGEAGELEG